MTFLEELSHVKPLTMFTGVENWNVEAVSGGNEDKYSVILTCTEISLLSEASCTEIYIEIHISLYWKLYIPANNHHTILKSWFALIHNFITYAIAERGFYLISLLLLHIGIKNKAVF